MGQWLDVFGIAHLRAKLRMVHQRLHLWDVLELQPVVPRHDIAVLCIGRYGADDVVVVYKVATEGCRRGTRVGATDPGATVRRDIRRGVLRARHGIVLGRHRARERRRWPGRAKVKRGGTWAATEWGRAKGRPGKDNGRACNWGAREGRRTPWAGQVRVHKQSRTSSMQHRGQERPQRRLATGHVI